MSTSFESRLAQIPVQVVPMSIPVHGGEAPIRDALGMLGEPVVSIIGKPVAATSDFDTDGFSVLDGQTLRNRSPVLLWIQAGAAALIVAFVGFLCGALIFERSGGLPAAGAIAFLAAGATFYLTLLLNRPKREGVSYVVGEQGLQVGTLRGPTADRMVFAFDDPREAWLESTVRTYAVSAGMMKPGIQHTAPSGAPTYIVRHLAVMSRDDRSVTWRCSSSIEPGARNRPLKELLEAQNRLFTECFLVISEAYERMRAARCEQALADLRAMKPLELPAVDQRSVFITPNADGTLGIEVRKRGDVIFRPSSNTVELKAGRYTLHAGDRREVFERADLGDAFLLDLLFLNIPPEAIPTSGSFSRNALIPKELLGK